MDKEEMVTVKNTPKEFNTIFKLISSGEIKKVTMSNGELKAEVLNVKYFYILQKCCALLIEEKLKGKFSPVSEEDKMCYDLILKECFEVEKDSVN